MNKHQSKWVSALSLGAVLSAFVVILGNTIGNDQLSGVFAVTSLMLALAATPLAFTMSKSIPIEK